MDYDAAGYYEFNKFCKAISAHAEFSKFIAQKDGVPYPVFDLCMFELSEVPKDLMDLYDKVAEFCDQILITPKGQCSSVFYGIRAYGIETKVLESDSCGPLVCMIVEPEKKWCFIYS